MFYVQTFSPHISLFLLGYALSPGNDRVLDPLPPASPSKYFNVTSSRVGPPYVLTNYQPNQLGVCDNASLTASCIKTKRSCWLTLRSC